MNNNTFTRRLIKAMTKANIKQAELSEITGIAKSSISEYIAGTYEPKQKNIFKIATALNVTPSYLMGITDENLSSIETLTDKIRLLPDDKQQELEKIKDSNFMIITDEAELDLLKKYRKLSENSRGIINALLENAIELTQPDVKDEVS